MSVRKLVVTIHENVQSTVCRRAPRHRCRTVDGSPFPILKGMRSYTGRQGSQLLEARGSRGVSSARRSRQVARDGAHDFSAGFLRGRALGRSLLWRSSMATRSPRTAGTRGCHPIDEHFVLHFDPRGRTCTRLTPSRVSRKAVHAVGCARSERVPGRWQERAGLLRVLEHFPSLHSVTRMVTDLGEIYVLHRAANRSATRPRAAVTMLSRRINRFGSSLGAQDA